MPKKQDMPKRLDSYVNVEDAAEIAGISGRRVRQLIEDGVFRAVQISQRSFLVVKADAEKYDRCRCVRCSHRTRAKS